MEKEQAKQARDAGLDPLMEKSFGELLEDIPKRLIALVSKSITWTRVVLGGVLIGSGFFLYHGKLDSMAFVAIVVLSAFGLEGLRAWKEKR